MSNGSGPSSPSLQALEDQHFALYDNRDAMDEACGDDEGCKKRVWDLYSTARRNHDDCINKIFEQNNPLVQSATKDCQTATAEMNKALQNLQNMVQVLKVVTAAVQVGSKLASLAIAA